MTRDTSTLNCQITAPNQHHEVDILLRGAFTPCVRKLGRELAEEAWLEPAVSDAGCHGKDAPLRIEMTKDL